MRSNIKEKKLLELKNVTGNGINNVSLCVHEGEVVGLAGLVGAGRTELASVIIGAAKLESGEIILDGESIHCKSPQKAIAQGIGMIPEDRKKQGCFLHSGVDWNISISTLKKLSHPVMNLSGGNQQKVVIAKVLAADSRVIIFDEPTRGIDVGAKHEIYTLMKKLADEGKAILMISSDMEELLGMSDRIYVLSGGNITGELGRDEYSQSHILELASVN